MTKVNQSRVREALTAGTNVKEKGPPVADGILTVTPDTPEMLEWRSRSALDVAETSSTFLDDEDDGPKPHGLYGKFTWKIENFSEISKRELRSNVFDVGSYKWYILVYPQGCDVCNHLSLFLCVADYDKLLPGWSHFAQFTIAVVNKDPKKSKYSDTLHRFCKKEHDWGWKKFMELSKVLDGFTVADTLVIKAQVQVILDKPSKPFRCLDPQYRRELVRVYLTNVEGICRRFCDDKKARLAWTREEALSFRHFWGSLTPEHQRKLLTDKGEVILKAVVKQFFNEKEVTSTLVMDALYSGCKQIEEHSRTWLEGKGCEAAPVVLVKAERNTFTLCGDLMEIADRVQRDFIPAAKDDSKGLQSNDGLTLRSGQDGDDYRRDSIERDEKRLAELGRKTIEMFVIAHIFCEKLEIAYREAEALKRQDKLIAEEFEMARLEESKAQAKAQADKEKKAKKKEKLKLRKEAERLRREAEEAERRAREEEAERKAKEAEKKRLEDAQAQPQAPQQQQQQHGRKGGRSREDRRVQQVAQQAAQQQQQQQAKAKQQAAASVSGQQLQQQPAAGPSKEQAQPSEHRTSGVSLSSLSSLAAAAVAVAQSVASAVTGVAKAAASSSQPERPDPHEVSPSESGSEEVGTVNHATGAAESSGDTEDEVEMVGTSSAAGPGAGTGTDSDGASDSEGRAALEEEVTILRAQVVQLQKLLAERDAELFALRAQLAELQPTEIADMVKEAAAGAAAASGAARAASSAPSSSASSVVADSVPSATPAAGAAVPLAASSSTVAGREAGPGESSPAVAAPAPSGAMRPDQERTSRTEPVTANGPKDACRPESLSPPAVAAAAAAAAVRRMHSTAGTTGTSAPSQDLLPLTHPGSAPPRSPSTGPTVSSTPTPAVVAAAAGRAAIAAQPRPGSMHAAGGAEPAAHPVQPQAAPTQQRQQPGPAATAAAAATSGENHVAAAPAVMMQRSTSVTLPAVSTSTSMQQTAGPGPFTQLGQQLAAAAANGRSRATSAAPLENPASATSGAQGAAGAKGAAPYLPTAAAAASSSVAVSANGIAGVLHAPAAATAVPDGLPSYRNAAAGVLASGPPGSSAMPAAAAPAAAPTIVAVPAAAAMMSVSPNTAAGSAAGGHKRVDETPAAATSAAVSAQRSMGHAVGTTSSAAATDGAFTTNARMMMQQAQRTGLAFSTPTAVQSASAKQRMAAAAQLDSPGLEDFAHINMIDDLLTE